MTAGVSPVTYQRRLVDLATEDSSRPALICIAPSGAERVWTRGELADAVRRTAHVLLEQGVGSGDIVAIALPNGAELVVLSYAAWWLGACALPLSPTLPAREQERILGAVRAAGRSVQLVDDTTMHDAQALDAGPAITTDPDAISAPGRAIASGGSTGSPKVIVDPRPHVSVPGVPNLTNRLLDRPLEHTALIFGPLYHTLSYGTVFTTLFGGGTVVLMQRFDDVPVLDAIERHGVQVLAVVPAHLARLAAVADIDQRDLSSIVSLYHSGAPCPGWLKRRWLDLLGPERVFEGFGSTEAVGMLVIRGDDWLEHEGSVGRCDITEVEIRADGGNAVPDGEVGEIFLRWRTGAGYSLSDVDRTFEYWGAPPAREAPGGFVSVGDLGYLRDGYLYVADRRTDMIISGGVNVYPAEIEAVLSAHPTVADLVVIGVEDERWGRRVHAIVQSAPGVDVDRLQEELDARCREELSAVKAPKTYEFVDRIPRNDIGKINRSALVAARSAQPHGEAS